MSDNFSISSTRAFNDNEMLLTGGCETRWNNWVLIKLNIFTWRLRLHNIPTRDRLSSRGITVDSILCPVCSITIESIEHLLSSCSELLTYGF